MVRALQNNDLDAFLALCTTREDLLTLLDSGVVPPDQRERARASLDRHVRRNDERRRENFADLQRGVDWSRVTIKGFERSPLKEENGLRGYKNVWVLLDGAPRPVLEIDGVGLIERGWVIFDDLALSLIRRVPASKGRPRPEPLATTARTEAPPPDSVPDAPPLPVGPDVVAPPQEPYAQRARVASTPEELAEDVLRALRRNDVRAFLSLCGDSEDVRAVLRAAGATRAQAKKGLAALRDKVPGVNSSRRSNFRRAKRAINWLKAAIANVRMEKRPTTDRLSRPLDSALARLMPKAGRALVEISGPTPGVLRLGALLETPRGWVLLGDTPMAWNTPARKPPGEPAPSSAK